jgi:hypothetical protein
MGERKLINDLNDQPPKGTEGQLQSPIHNLPTPECPAGTEAKSFMEVVSEIKI